MDKNLPQQNPASSVGKTVEGSGKKKAGPRPRKIPMRMCVGCREMKPKKELLRVVKSPAGVVSVDRVGKAQGRGVYVCTDEGCLARAVKQRQLERALETPIDGAVFEQLRAEITRG